MMAEAGDLASHRLNHPLAVTHTPSWRARLKDIRLPTLVFHGAEDGCLPLPHGEALAREVPGARLQVVEGMGHILAPGSRYWDLLADAVIDHSAGARQ
jgi:pimeloyl-ACP methyl ester carboxylesterase